MAVRPISRLISVIAIALFACAVAACSSSSDDDDGDTVASEIRRASERDLPWEVSSPQGESIVPNVFYAEASENEQVAPLTIDGRHVIDRLVYPTIGNPNLFVRTEKGEMLAMVMRLEPELLAHLAPQIDQTGNAPVTRLTLDDSDRDRLAFQLVDRSAREAATESNGAVAAGPGVFAIRPKALLLHRVPADMPEPFKARWTIRALFDREAMSQVPPALYDVRMEVIKDAAIARAPNGTAAYEFHYNALRVFDRPLRSLVNVTDTQVSVGTKLEAKTLPKLRDFVARVNATTDPRVREAAFITFNGDLHNGGSPEAISPLTVATTYQNEAKTILATLKELTLPIFLTLGNHDGYASTGHAPALFESRLADFFGKSLEDAVDKLGGATEWPGFTWPAYQRYLAETDASMGGKHLDIFSGPHVRRPATTFAKGWLPVDRAKRNMMLYDGVHQWQRTYGPTYASWRYGKTRFVNLDSYDLRQHRRTGWGMYTVNYGGGLSKVQLQWANRELDRAEAVADDVVVIAHHDPRGGHRGKDFPFYFEQLEYSGIDQSFGNYVQGELLGKTICGLAPAWAQTDEQKELCLHDGLQEWMRPDPDFDCEDEDRLWGDPDFRCDAREIAERGRSYSYSGYAALDAIYRHPRVRTVLLGHTHYNSLEVLQGGDALVPTNITLDPAAIAAYGVQNPLRAHTLTLGTSHSEQQALIEAAKKDLAALERAGGFVARDGLEGEGRELVILRLTCNADMSNQKAGTRAMYGFATLGLSKRDDYDAPQINEVSFFINDGGRFEEVKRVAIDRKKRIGNGATDATNPLHGIFDSFGK